MSVPPSNVKGVLADLLSKVLAALLTATGFLGAVAVVGGVTVWFGFYTAQLPAVQAIDVMPRSQLLVNGAVPLVMFGVLSAVAVAICYAVDRGGRPREGIVHSLILLFAAATAWIVILAPLSRRDEVKLLILIALGAAVGAAVARFRQEPGQETCVPLPGETTAPIFYRTSTSGQFGLAALIGFVAGAALIATWEWWIVAAVLTAGGLTMLNLRIAQAAEGRRITAETELRNAGSTAAVSSHFAPLALGVFFSIPLYGALATLLYLADNPLVQPAVALRATAEGRSLVQGLYIADDGTSVYFGSVASDGCNRGRLRRVSGTMFSVPKSEILHLRIGRRQTVADALVNTPSLARMVVNTAATFPDRRTSKEKRTGKASTVQGTPPQPMWPLRYSRDEAIRQEPRIEGASPADRRPGQQVRIAGKNFGDVRGRVLIGGRTARIITWDDDEILAVVPNGASANGKLVIRCPSLDPTLLASGG